MAPSNEKRTPCPDCTDGYRIVPMSKRDPLLGEWFVPCRTCTAPASGSPQGSTDG